MRSRKILVVSFADHVFKHGLPNGSNRTTHLRNHCHHQGVIPSFPLFARAAAKLGQRTSWLHHFDQVFQATLQVYERILLNDGEGRSKKTVKYIHDMLFSGIHYLEIS